MKINIALGLLMLCATGAQAGLLSILDISTIKDSELEMCPNITIEKMVDSFFEDPEWSSGKAADGRKLVNVSGTITYDNQPARALMQIWMRDDAFSVEALEINGRPQPEGMLNVLLAKMCQSANGNNTEASEPQTKGLPFTGTRYFNFIGGSGTQQSITIDPNGLVTLRSYSAGGNVSVDYEGMYENPLLTPAGNYRVHADKIYVTDEGGDFPDPSECEEVACETDLYVP